MINTHLHSIMKLFKFEKMKVNIIVFVYYRVFQYKIIKQGQNKFTVENPRPLRIVSVLNISNKKRI